MVGFIYKVSGTKELCLKLRFFIFSFIIFNRLAALIFYFKWKFSHWIHCRTKTKQNPADFMQKNCRRFSKFDGTEFCWRLVFGILIIHKPSLGTYKVPHKFLAPMGSAVFTFLRGLALWLFNHTWLILSIVQFTIILSFNIHECAFYQYGFWASDLKTSTQAVIP